MHLFSKSSVIQLWGREKKTLENTWFLLMRECGDATFSKTFCGGTYQSQEKWRSCGKMGYFLWRWPVKLLEVTGLHPSVRGTQSLKSGQGRGKREINSWLVQSITNQSTQLQTHLESGTDRNYSILSLYSIYRHYTQCIWTFHYTASIICSTLSWWSKGEAL